MSDHWYYADKEVPVGPFSLRELKNVLEGLPSGQETLVWKEGFGKWQKAASIADLNQLDHVPPPIPPVQNHAGQSGNEPTTPLGRPRGMSRKAVFLVVGSYFLAAFALAVFLEMRKPFATWAKLFDAYPLGSIIGAAVGLFLVSGLIPVAVWAFRRFRAENASGPLYAWLALLVIFGFMVAYGQSFDLERKLGQIGRTTLTGKHRQDFVVGARRGCIGTQQQDPLNRQAGVTDAQISAYCDCYANALANNLTPDEIVHYAKFGKPSAATQRKIEELLPTCTRAAIGKQSSMPGAPPETVRATATSQDPSLFVAVKLPRGIELQLPRGWWLIGSKLNRLIEMSSGAALDLSGIGVAGGQRTNLIAANSMPPSTYASVRVDSTVPPSASASEFSGLTTADLEELQRESRANLLKMLPLQGNQLIDFHGVRIDRIAGYPAIVTEYRRTGPKGQVIVQVNQIFTAQQEIGINLSYRETETALWKPVIGKIRQSIIVRRWP
jgi:uncharacterized membrane protein YhaH (DUF805 family)